MDGDNFSPLVQLFFCVWCSLVMIFVALLVVAWSSLGKKKSITTIGQTSTSSEKLSHVEKALSKIALYTSVPADLIAILPVVYTLLYKPLEYFHLVPQVEFKTSHFAVGEGIQIPLRDLVLLTIFYGFVATLYWIGKNIQSQQNPSATKVISHLRQLSLSITLILGVPVPLSLAMFGIIPNFDALATSIISGFLAYAFWKRWTVSTSRHYSADEIVTVALGEKTVSDSQVGQLLAVVPPPQPFSTHERVTVIEFQDIGWWYLLWIPAIWSLFEFLPSSHWLINLIKASFYASSGYVLSLIIFVCLKLFCMRLTESKEKKERRSRHDASIPNLYEHIRFRADLYNEEVPVPLLVAISTIVLAIYVAVGNTIFSFILSAILPSLLFWTIWLGLLVVFAVFVIRAMRT